MCRRVYIPDWTLRLGIGLPFTVRPWTDTMLCEGSKWFNVPWIGEVSQQSLAREHYIGRGRSSDYKVLSSESERIWPYTLNNVFEVTLRLIPRSMSRQWASAVNAPNLKTDDFQSIAISTASYLKSASSRFGSSPTLGFPIRRGADKSLAFLICITTQKMCLGWVKEVRTTKS
jgi:hypothetical protein